MNIKFKHFVFAAFAVLIHSVSVAQCTWHQTLFDSFEYTTPCPDLVPGMTFQSAPQSYAVHSGNYSLYMNFVNCNGGTGACPGDSIYIRNVSVCPGMPVRFSMWFTTSFSGTQCDVQIKIFDTLNILLATTPSILAPYSPVWTQYTSPTVYPLTSNVKFVVYTNIGGSPGGNDLSLDDFSVEKCYEEVTLGPDTSICSNQTVTLLPSGSFNNYLWNDGSTADSLVAFTTNITDTLMYYVSVTDSNGCAFSSDTAQVFFTDCNLAPIAALSSSDTLFCEKQCINFYDLSTNNPTSWLWLFPGADSTTSTQQNPINICYNSYGSFDVTLIACNASSCDTIFIPGFIKEFPNPIDSIYFINDTLWSLQANNYQWYEVSSGIVSGATNQYFLAQNPGNYYCVITDSIGCIATSNILIATGLQNFDDSNSFMLTPNPNNGTFQIQFNESIKNGLLKIYDAMGKEVYESSISKSSTQLALQFNSGIYFLQVFDGEKFWRKKLVVDLSK